jgi:glycosyltransferase involved in cell wall biosynthesis
MERIDPIIGLAVTLAYVAALTFVFIRARRRFLAIPELIAQPPPSATSDCMVVISACNEADVIGRAVKSLPPDTVIVIDDASKDATAAEAEQAGAGVLHAPPLPKGALGKSHARMVGARVIVAKWILFADADTWYEQNWIETLVGTAKAQGLSFLSVHLKQEPATIASHVLSPYAAALFFASVDPRSSIERAFRGECILARREAFEFLGGRTLPVNDNELAGLALRHRMKTAVVRTKLGHVADCEGWRGWWDKIARNWQSSRQVPAVLLGALWLPVAFIAYISGWPVLAVAVVILPVLLLLPWYSNMLRALLAPVAVYAMLPMAGHALYRIWTGKKVQWKGREI